MDNELDGQEVVELYPSEIAEVKILWAALQRKYGERAATVETMRHFKREVEDRFLNELGLRVVVDSANLEPVGDADEFVVSPIIEIVGRVQRSDIDHARIARETQLGYADLQPGTITPDGRFVDPQRYF